MFVGQAPGQDDDQRGKVFCGNAGIFLEEVIQEYALHPAYLTNTVRCAPSKDRLPKADEVKACKPFLMKEIEELKPKVIVVLGNIALRALTGRTGIMDLSGQVVGEIGKAKVFALYHPDYVLKVPKDLHKFEMHVRSLQDVIAGRVDKGIIKGKSVTVKEAGDLLFLKGFLKSTEVVTIDFETTGKSKAEGGEIRCVGFHTESAGSFAVDAKDFKFDDFMQEVIESFPLLQAHNSIFEMHWFLEEWGRIPKGMYYDTFLMHYLLDENSSHDLESIASQYLQAKSWDIGPEMDKNGWDWATIPYDKLVAYNGLDCYYTAELGKVLWQKIKDQGLEEFYRDVLFPTAKLCAKMEYRGLKIDRKYLDTLTKLYTGDCEVLLDDMITKFKLKSSFNPGSSQQITAVLDGLRIKTKEKTPSGKVSVNEKALEPLRDKNPFISLYLDWKQKDTAIHNFLEKYPALLDKEDIVHPSCNPGFIVTVRIAVSKPPAQNISGPVRGIVASRFPGGKLLYADYSQLEMRLLISESGEERMINLLNEGRDIHDLTARDLFGEGFTPEQRKIAKSINFLTVYGGGAKKLSKTFNVKKHIAEDWLKKFWDANPKIAEWMSAQHDFVRKNGWLKSRFGQIRRLPDAQSQDEYIVWRCLRQAGNYPIQEQGAVITNLSAVVANKLLEQNHRSQLVLIVHDALLIDVYPKEEQNVAKLVRRVMEEDVPGDYCPWLKVKLTTSQAFGERWS